MNIFFTSPQIYTIYLAELLSLQHNYNPVFFFTSEDSKKILDTKFPSVQSQNYIKACKGIRICGNWESKALSFQDLQFLKQHIHVAMHMMERNDSNARDFDFLARENFFYSQASYYKGLLLHQKIELVIFEEEPHQINDYIIYLVAKMIDCKTLMAVRSISNLGIIYKTDYSDNDSFLFGFDKNDKRSNSELLEELPDDVLKYYRRIQGNYHDVLKEHLWDQIDQLEIKKMLKTSSVITKLLHHKKMLLKKITRRKLYNLMITILHFNSDQKVRKKSLQNSKQSFLGYRISKYLTIRKKKDLEKYYQSLTKGLQELAHEKFIVLALQYQPEKSTCPLAGDFVNQQLILESLLDALPSDIKIVLREHPSQFVAEYTRYGECYRTKQYYDQLNVNERVIFSDLGDDVFEIIDKSLAVCSAGGTILWEARLRGKMGINFAHAWFNALDGIHHVENYEDLMKCVGYIKSGLALDERECIQFLLRFCQASVIAAIGGPPQLEHYGLSAEQNANRHLRAIANCKVVK